MCGGRPVLVVRAAYLEVCAGCGKHARIVGGSDKQLGEEFSSQEDGLTLVAVLTDDGAITIHEAMFLRQAIRLSSLPATRAARKPALAVLVCSPAPELPESPELQEEGDESPPKWVN